MAYRNGSARQKPELDIVIQIISYRIDRETKVVWYICRFEAKIKDSEIENENKHICYNFTRRFNHFRELDLALRQKFSNKPKVKGQLPGLPSIYLNTHPTVRSSRLTQYLGKLVSIPKVHRFLLRFAELDIWLNAGLQSSKDDVNTGNETPHSVEDSIHAFIGIGNSNVSTISPSMLVSNDLHDFKQIFSVPRRQPLPQHVKPLREAW
mmetsp:Transcript_22210/g.27157  ORF Transcript_22210/g.27157 Transcript_22210/m.27157 type:complete len:208 (-) Transcript_22210:1935-2558(-)